MRCNGKRERTAIAQFDCQSTQQKLAIEITTADKPPQIAVPAMEDRGFRFVEVVTSGDVISWILQLEYLYNYELPSCSVAAKSEPSMR